MSRASRSHAPQHWLVVCIAVLALGPSAHAHEGSGPVRKPTRDEVRALVSQLPSADEARLAGLIARLAESDRLEAAQALEQLILAGQKDAVTELAVAALGRLARPETFPTLVLLMRHRRAEVRLHAFQAAARVRTANAGALLARGLDDADPRVRAAAARALADHDAREQVPSLLRALDHVPEAAAALGALIDETAAAQLHERLGTTRLEALLAAYEPLLLRKDLSEAVKLEAVARLEDLGSQEVERFFRALLARSARALPPSLQRAVVATLARSSKGPTPSEAP